jgi:hypothetical protein
MKRAGEPTQQLARRSLVHASVGTGPAQRSGALSPLAANGDRRVRPQQVEADHGSMNPDTRLVRPQQHPRVSAVEEIRQAS